MHFGSAKNAVHTCREELIDLLVGERQNRNLL